MPTPRQFREQFELNATLILRGLELQDPQTTKQARETLHHIAEHAQPGELHGIFTKIFEGARESVAKQASYYGAIGG